MGARGPIGKRSDQRLGHMTKAERAAFEQVEVEGAVEVPPADASWHPLAREWYEALGKSGQKKFFEPTDWVAARLVAHEMTRMLSRRVVSSQMFAALWSAMGDLLTTEDDRRRMKIEVNRTAPKPNAADAKVTRLDDYRAL